MATNIYGFGLHNYSSEEKKMKHAMTVFDDYDFKSDAERETSLMVYTNEQLIAEDEDLAVFSKHFKGKKTPETLMKALNQTYFFMYHYDEY
jgi:hypothetical protein